MNKKPFESPDQRPASISDKNKSILDSLKVTINKVLEEVEQAIEDPKSNPESNDDGFGID